MKQFIFELCKALFMTILLEGAFVFVIKRQKTWIWLSVAGNLITNPALNLLLILPARKGMGVYIPSLIVLEMIAVFVEAALYRYYTEEKRKHCFLIALGANAVSFFCGWLIEWIL